MDISLRCEEGWFNLRTAAIIIHEGRILTLRDEGIDHDYLPGGRIHLRESAEDALRRELREELDIPLPENRLVFVAESFFTFQGIPCHEVCFYHLMDAPAELLLRGEGFTRVEDGEIHHFHWLTFDELKQTTVFPLFLRERIRSLPDAPEHIICYS